ncbi:MAG: nuclear transport factor 2 family protein [Holophagaceae bacterium]|nr:nuclear transport factor 2 family protein [Holophagaceae bacterium]
MFPPNTPSLLLPYLQAYFAHDLEEVLACFAEDATLWSAGLEAPLKGREALRAFYRQTLPLQEKMKLHCIRSMVLGQEVVSLSELTMVLPSLWSEPRHFTTITVYLFNEAGRIQDLRMFVDVEGAIPL